MDIRLSDTLNSEYTEFDAKNREHLELLKSLYFAWFSPMESHKILFDKHNIIISLDQVRSRHTRWRQENISRYDRNKIIRAYAEQNHNHNEE